MNSYSLSTVRESRHTAIVSEKGQVTIPKAIRDRLGLRNGTKIAFLDDEGLILGAKVIEDDPFASVWGIVKLPDGVTVDDLINEIRGPVDIP